MAEPSFKDLAYRALANTLGGPVGMFADVMRPFGYNVPPEQVFGSAEYIGRKMEEGGLVSEARDPTQEFIASMMVPTPTVPLKAAGMIPELLAGAMGLGTIAGARGTSSINKIVESNGSNVIPESLVDVSYRGTHTAPDASVYGATIDSLQGIMPADVYSPKGKRLYGLYDPQVDNEWFTAVIKAKGNPEAKIDVYRAVPKGVKNINDGDWVTTSKRYAEMHGENTLDGDYEIIKQTVPAKTLHSEGAPYEFGYREINLQE